MECDVLQSIHLQYWVACGLWHHYCPSHLEASGMVWVGECTSLYLCVHLCVVCVCLSCVSMCACAGLMEGQVKGNHSNQS